MNDREVQSLIQDNAWLLGGAELKETLISWVILTEKLAFKIKKPVTFSFLDFSTVAKRKFFCERELFLNQRLTEGIYLDVVSIDKSDDQTLGFDLEKGERIDYAVKMKRLDSDRQMDILLEKGLVNRPHLQQLATQLANFHITADTVMIHPNLKEMQEDFADLLKIVSFVGEHWGKESELLLYKGVEYSKKFLEKFQSRIYERHLEGFTVDGHGDLHVKNIFLLDEPVIFDCIEFNDHLRRLDILNELAFLCMDLDLYDQHELSNYFIEEYIQHYVCMNRGADEKLFQYYKLYRANVRMKINAMKAQQINEAGAFKKQLSRVEAYLNLFEHYLRGK